MGTLLMFLASALWGFVHSLTASIKLKDTFQQAFGSKVMNWYRLAFNSFSFITFLPLLVLTVLLPDRPLYEIPDPWVEITFIIQIMAAIALVVGVLQTDVWYFIGVRQIIGGQSQDKIVTGGLYRFVRHPLYTAGLVFIWLTPAMTLNRLALYLCLTLYIFIGAYLEERKLLREFGIEYLEYQARTPMLIPFIVGHK
jgi:methanethiol S-methyltransferase